MYCAARDAQYLPLTGTDAWPNANKPTELRCEITKLTSAWVAALSAGPDQVFVIDVLIRSCAARICRCA